MIDFAARHAELLEHRVKKRFRHLRARMERASVGAYRLYDWDIPEVRARVDYYEGHLVVAEYERDQTRHHPDYLRLLGEAAARAIDAPLERVHLKTRRTRPRDGARYERLDSRGERLVVREGPLRFWVNLDDYLDTGLFFDHRQTRAWLGELVRGCAFLNLFAYTGAFTCAAAHGGARSTTSVDLSRRYLDWAQDNLELNGLAGERHEFFAENALAFLDRASRQGRRWDTIFVDPPSFSTVGVDADSPADPGDFDVLRDHPELLERCLARLTPGGLLVFSTNHQRFEMQFQRPGVRVEEITRRTLPEDCRHQTPHRCFTLRTG